MYEPLVSTTADLLVLLREFRVRPALYMPASDYVTCDEWLMEQARVELVTPTTPTSSGDEGEMCLPDGPLMRDERSRRRAIRNVTHAYVCHAEALGIAPAEVAPVVGAFNGEVPRRVALAAPSRCPHGPVTSRRPSGRFAPPSWPRSAALAAPSRRAALAARSRRHRGPFVPPSRPLQAALATPSPSRPSGPVAYPCGPGAALPGPGAALPGPGAASAGPVAYPTGAVAYPAAPAPPLLAPSPTLRPRRHLCWPRHLPCDPGAASAGPVAYPAAPSPTLRPQRYPSRPQRRLYRPRRRPHAAPPSPRGPAAVPTSAPPSYCRAARAT
ncbi:unnamed protein product [Closterium sp. NIES-64]|nr:unnamed protein product [Closterium sp. NIES-64]